MWRVKIRRFVATDRAFVIQLADATQREMRRIDPDHYAPVLPGEAAGWFDDGRRASWKKDTRILIAEVNGVPAGFLIAGPADEPWTRGSEGRPARRRSGEILELHVEPDYRGKGVGSSLLRAAERELGRQGFGEIILGHLAENATASRLYEGLGYRPKWVVRVKRIGTPKTPRARRVLGK
jgi:ribosomal protein S18 acetylase RimI-like enzyme